MSSYATDCEGGGREFHQHCIKNIYEVGAIAHDSIFFFFSILIIKNLNKATFEIYYMITYKREFIYVLGNNNT